MKSEPGPHPEPPPDFHRRTLPISTHGGSLFRTHLHNVAPLYFGRTGRNRFDDPKGRYGVLYAARDPFGAFIETFGQDALPRSFIRSRPFRWWTCAARGASLELGRTAVCSPRIGPPPAAGRAPSRSIRTA